MGKRGGGRSIKMKMTATKGTQMRSNRPCRVCGEMIYAGRCIKCEIDKVSRTGQLPSMTPEQKAESRKAMANMGITKDNIKGKEGSEIVQSIFEKDEKDNVEDRRKEIMRRINVQKRKMKEMEDFVNSLEDELFTEGESSSQCSDYDKSTEIIEDDDSIDDFIDDLENEL